MSFQKTERGTWFAGVWTGFSARWCRKWGFRSICEIWRLKQEGDKKRHVNHFRKLLKTFHTLFSGEWRGWAVADKKSLKWRCLQNRPQKIETTDFQLFPLQLSGTAKTTKPETLTRANLSRHSKFERVQTGNGDWAPSFESTLPSHGTPRPYKPQGHRRVRSWVGLDRTWRPQRGIRTQAGKHGRHSSSTSAFRLSSLWIR